MTQLALGFKKAIYVGEGSNIFYTVRGPSESPFWPEAAIVASNTDGVIMIILGTPR